MRAILLVFLVGSSIWLLTLDNAFVAVPLFLALLAFAYVIDARVGDMRLAVNDRAVEIVNFLSSHNLDLMTVVVDTETEDSEWPADDLPPSATGEAPRLGSLLLWDHSGQKVKVGVAPSYGDQLETIANDLKIAISRHRL